jgi:hypothetical protein
VTLSEYRGSTEPPEYEYDLIVISSGDFAVTTSINGTEQVYAGTGNQRYSLGHHPPGTEIEAWGVNEGIQLLLNLISEKDWQVRDECLETGCEARLMKVVPEVPGDAWTAFFPTYIGAVEGAGISEAD